MATGSRKVSNDEIAAKCPDWTAGEILKRVGIESRYWVGEGETVVTLGAKAARKLLAAQGLTIRDIDLLIATTGTPPTTTPSTAALILHDLSEGASDIYVQAHDINAACSGYLYGLQAAYDYLYTRPDRRVAARDDGDALAAHRPGRPVDGADLRRRRDRDAAS